MTQLISSLRTAGGCSQQIPTRAVMIAAAGLLAASPMAYAQAQEPEPEPPLVTDRPDITESSVLVGRGYLQFETGFTFEREVTGDASVGTVTVPSSLLRVGVSKRVELRLSTDGIVSAATGTVRVTGMADLETGVKVRLSDQERIGVDMALLSGVSWPAGNAAVTSGGADPKVTLAWGRTLPAPFSLSGNYGVASVSDPLRRFTQQAASFTLGFDLREKLSGYVETDGLIPMERDTRAAWTIDAGLARIIGSNLQFDIEAGRGITDAAPNWFVGFGFAIRGRVIRH